ncbi:hypothetical protein JI742_06040 [Piscinibacter sp. Jin2]|uniref:Uncharacterized protein n=2 Tax=Aquariibacter lacus TaxID=2801332 RepID=A0A9X1BN93_9BURK|nr:hypothetical protein [Piscinibacter lacus]
MNLPRPAPMARLRRAAAMLALAGSGLLAAGGAQAGSDIHWSIGVQLPPIGTVISNHPQRGYGYGAPPVVVYPGPAVVYGPAPRWDGPPRHHGWHRAHDRGWHKGYREGRRDERRDDRRDERRDDRWDRWDRHDGDRRGHGHGYGHR